jgi:KDO2-lipid IV(A) lauroyltransferase
VHVQALPVAVGEDTEASVASINAALEGLILQCPQQYLWGYERYKNPRQESA